MTESAIDAAEARRRILALFEYQKELAQLTKPKQLDMDRLPFSLKLEGLPEHPCIELRASEPGRNEEQELAALLRVRRPTVPDCPPLPKSLDGWVEGAWNSADQQPKPLESRVLGVESLSFSDSSVRVADWATWTALRERWIMERDLALRALALYQRMWDLHVRLEVSAGDEDLVLANGIVHGKQSDGGLIRYPVLIQRLEIAFEPSVPEFTIEYTGDAPQCLADVPRAVHGHVGPELERAISFIRSNPVDVYASHELTSFLRTMAGTLGQGGQYVSGGQCGTAVTDEPVVVEMPTMLVRNRRDGIVGAIDKVIELIEQSEELPDGLARLVGYEAPAPVVDSCESEHESLTGQARDLLFAKPANAEQIAIARRLESARSVIVQGPPGTGKSHTIANLIGHLLASGDRILVTAHTTKALRVLRGQLPLELQSLCVSYLDSDRASNSELEAAVSEISERSNEDVGTLQRAAERSAQLRTDSLDRLEGLAHRLRLARTAEVHPLEDVNGLEVAPARAAEWVAGCERQHGWIPGRALVRTLPLAVEDLRNLYVFNENVSEAEERRATEDIPEVSRLFTSSEFEQLVAATRHLTPEDASMDSALLFACLEELRSVVADAGTIARSVDELSRGAFATVLEECLAGAVSSETWQRTEDEARLAADRAEAAIPVLAEHSVVLAPGADLGEVSEWIQRRRTSAGGIRPLGPLERLGLRVPRGVVHARVNDRTPKTERELAALDVVVAAGIAVERFSLRIQRMRLGDAVRERLATARPAPVLRDIADGVARAREVASRANALMAVVMNHGQLKNRGRLWSERHDTVSATMVSRLRDAEAVARARVLELEAAAAASLLRDGQAVLERWRESETGRLLAAALERRDPAAYEEALQVTMNAAALRPSCVARATVLAQLYTVAPEWADAIADRAAGHAGTRSEDDIMSAWRWRVLKDQLDERLALDEREVAQQMLDVRRRMERATTQTVEKFAWLQVCQRMTMSQRQALQGWATTVKKLGKGTGKLAPLRRAEARRLLERCQSAVPVWIAPLSRVYEMFVTSSQGFDVVIVDEASQADVFALMAVALGKRVVVVGDDEQVSPMDVGVDVVAAQAVVDRHLRSVPNRSLYGPRHSLYDLARTSFGASVQLKEHFRCVPDIIAFSNELSYAGSIKPLRPAGTQLLPAVIGSFLADGMRGAHKTNPREALRVAALVSAMCEDEAYEGASIGVMSLLGDEQAALVDSIIRRVLSPVEIEARRIVCGTPPQFQGDEREVVVLTMVDSPQEGPLRLSDRIETKQRFNVAVSRARDQLWVVHSISHQLHLKPGDLRHRLLSFVADPSALVRNRQRVSQQAESPFEREVFQRLVSDGFDIEPQVWIGHYRVDAVVRADGKAVVLECDGERFHPPEQLLADMQRQAVLERLGHRFVRLRGSRYYGDKNGAYEWLVDQLKAQGIVPTWPSAADVQERVPPADGLRARVLARAEALELEWRASAIVS